MEKSNQQDFENKSEAQENSSLIVKTDEPKVSPEHSETAQPKAIKEQGVGSNALKTFFVGSGICIAALVFGIGGGFLGARLSESTGEARRGESTVVNNPVDNVSVIDQSSAVVDVAEKSAPSVVSIVITRDLPVFEDSGTLDIFGRPRQRRVGTQPQQVGAGTGFVISQDGLIITNRHVVSDERADYTVVLSDNTRLEAEVLARDTLLDIAVIKATLPQNLKLNPLNLGDSDQIKIGQTAISIGNSLGRFSNTVSSGIISGLERTITASSRDGLDAQLLEGVIQTDASINPGNSGGPLLDVAGNVIGVNVAIAEGANNVGFAIPINFVKPVIQSVISFGEIKRPYLGVRYVQVTPEIASEQSLEVDFGAFVAEEAGAVIENSPAAKAGIEAGDHIVSINNVELKTNTSLQREIQKYQIGQEVTIGFYRSNRLQEAVVTLEELE